MQPLGSSRSLPLPRTASGVPDLPPSGTPSAQLAEWVRRLSPKDKLDVLRRGGSAEVIGAVIAVLPEREGILALREHFQPQDEWLARAMENVYLKAPREKLEGEYTTRAEAAIDPRQSQIVPLLHRAMLTRELARRERLDALDRFEGSR